MMTYKTVRARAYLYDKMEQNSSKSKQISQHHFQKLCYSSVVPQNQLKIKTYLLGLGFQPNLKGYHLLSRLLGLALCGEEILPLKYKGYVTLMKEFDIDAASIEKDIQNAISSAWLRGDVNVLYREFGETLDENKGKPTNKQFVLTALERLIQSAN